MYMEITVTNIIKKAGVARASFYRNFNSISDVIDALVDELSDDLIEITVFSITVVPSKISNANTCRNK